jgi:hypothetical protein
MVAHTFGVKVARGLAVLLAVGMLALAVWMAIDTPSAIEGGAKVLLVAPIVFWSLWYALWGWKRDFPGFEYISTDEPPVGPGERAMATSWLYFRRMVCAAGACAMAAYAVFLFLRAEWLLAAGLLVIVVGVIWYGVVGDAGFGSLPQHDLRSYRQRKRRYGWRW